VRWSLLGSKTVRRTCLDCGESWTLERSLARLRAGRPRGFGGGLLTGRVNLAIGQELAEQQVAEAGAALDQELETVRQLRGMKTRCTTATCGGLTSAPSTRARATDDSRSKSLFREAMRRGHRRLTVSYHAGPGGPEAFYERLGLPAYR